MPSPGAAIITKLLAAAGVTALVETRIWPGGAVEQDPQGDYIAVYRTGGGGGKRLGARNALQKSDWRVDCYASTEEQAEAILAAVVAAISGWSDRGVGVHLCWDTEDADEALAEDGGGGDWKVAGQTFSIWFQG